MFICVTVEAPEHFTAYVNVFHIASICVYRGLTRIDTSDGHSWDVIEDVDYVRRKIDEAIEDYRRPNHVWP